MAQALFALSKERQNNSMAMSAYVRAKTALDLAPNDAAIKTFYTEVKTRYDEVVAEDKKKKEEEQKAAAAREGPKEE